MSSARFLTPYHSYHPSAPEVPDDSDSSPYSRPPPPVRYLAMELEQQQNALKVFFLGVVRLSVLVLKRDCWFRMF